MNAPVSAMPRKGRGAIGNHTGRYEPHTRHAVDDGWWRDAELPPLVTTVTDEACRSVISRNTSPDVAFDRSINPYRGCEHGCVYCFARPTHAYLGLSPGLDFETKLFAKPDAPRLLAEELRKPSYRPRPIMLGANTDPYQPVERKRQLTRGILEVLAQFRHPVAIATKSALVVRDLDILAPLAEQRLVSVGLSITSLDPGLARVMEPRASAPGKRLAAVRALSEAGVPVAVMTAPLIPFVNDRELERILEAAAAAGASGTNYVLLRLPLELKELFTEWLEAHFPDRAARVLGCMRDCRDGQLYVADWGTRMKGTGEYARLLAQRFAIACRRLALAHGSPAARTLDCSQFRVPPTAGEQLSLL
jgi:DNA repair photolyase